MKLFLSEESKALGTAINIIERRSEQSGKTSPESDERGRKQAVAVARVSLKRLIEQRAYGGKQFFQDVEYCARMIPADDLASVKDLLKNRLAGMQARFPKNRLRILLGLQADLHDLAVARIGKGKSWETVRREFLEGRDASEKPLLLKIRTTLCWIGGVLGFVAALFLLPLEKIVAFALLSLVATLVGVFLNSRSKDQLSFVFEEGR